MCRTRTRNAAGADATVGLSSNRRTVEWSGENASSLAQLWRDQGRRTEARDLLAPVYGWFTEGFETADLKETKALLEELGSAG